jgi:hypothetical protein
MVSGSFALIIGILRNIFDTTEVPNVTSPELRTHADAVPNRQPKPDLMTVLSNCPSLNLLARDLLVTNDTHLLSGKAHWIGSS